MKILDHFESISLTECESVSLMNRVDSKYMFSIHQLDEILYRCLPCYRILEIHSVRNHFYDSLYFDTPDFLLYTDHHRLKLNRYKIRYRTYSSGTRKVFLEIKFKDNKEKTYKKRKEAGTDIPKNFLPALSDFIEHQTPYKSSQLIPSLSVRYHRITLVNKNFKERVTIDTGLTYSSSFSDCELPRLVIAEVKRNSFHEKTEIMNVFKVLKIQEDGLSKYCMGMALLNPELKKNNFKEKLRKIEKINL